ncbi:MAG TPA: sulfatase-like hydrolase/transferase [Acidobacteriota bacterium]|nr:sulfatase-like hydrolase/transferase [Acidobacteriota bacterium]
MKKAALAIIALLLIAGAYFVFFHRQKTVQVISIPSANILLITIDTLRPDHLSCYGGKNPTPNIDELAKNGVLFENAFCSVPLTFPSHTSILTGLFPIHTGVHNNGLEKFNRSEFLISTIFHQNGYKTGAVISSFVLDRKFGLAESFDVYDDKIERAPGIVSNFDVERNAAATSAAASGIVNRFAGNKWLLWVHFYDPHTPYAPPEPFQGYDGEIDFVDQQIGILLQSLKSQGVDKNLITIVMADHGESLGEHGEETHGYFIYNSTVKIPLLLSYPGAPKGTVVKATAAGVDVVPTLISLAGIHDDLRRDGESLQPLIAGESRKSEIYLESDYPELMGWNGLQGLINLNWKLISTTRSELYDWQKDVAEEQNLFSQQQQLSDSLKQRLANLTASAMAPSRQAPDSETLEKLRSLGYVGATNPVQTKFTVDPKDKIGAWKDYEKTLQLKNSGDPAGSLALLHTLVDREPTNSFFRLTLASNLREAGKRDEAIEQLKTILKDDPSKADAYQELALAEKEQKNYVEAVRAEQAAIALQPDRSEFHSVLGIILVETGQFEQAKGEFARVLKIDPNNGVAWNNLGNALRETNQLDQAAEAYRKSIQLSPHYAYPLNGLATVLIRQNETQQAIPYLEKALQLDPQFVEVYLNLGIAFQTIGENEKAKTCYRAFLKLAPEWMKQERQNAAQLLSQLS